MSHERNDSNQCPIPSVAVTVAQTVCGVVAGWMWSRVHRNPAVVFSRFSRPLHRVRVRRTGGTLASAIHLSFNGLVVAAGLTSLGATSAHANWSNWFPQRAPQTPHPSVVRISVQESDGVSYGSGTLVNIREQYGVVVTNWHVVRDANGLIQVAFPDGFRSAARVLSVDSDWDLAALLIWRPNAKPVRFASQAPVPGDVLTIAGYGPGNYRTESGRCTQYVAPSEKHPFEMVELSARARQGDSGGPIFNTHGELAGVLFGSDGGSTSGSFSGRVQNFLNFAWPSNVPAPNPDQLAGQVVPRRLPNVDSTPDQQPPPPSADMPNDWPAYEPLVPLPTDNSDPILVESHPSLEPSGPIAVEPVSTNKQRFSWEDLAGHTIFDQVKSVLATIGAFVVLLQVGRFLTAKQ